MGDRKTVAALHSPASSDLDAAIQAACARIAPTWPLDRFIAVNPLWGFLDKPLEQVSSRLSALSGSRMVMPRSWYRELFQSGRLRAEHLRKAVSLSESQVGIEPLTRMLDAAQPKVRARARVMDLVDEKRDLAHEMSWREFVVHNTSQLCASYFDDGQAQLGPSKEHGLYATFRTAALLDHSPKLLMGMRGYARLAHDLPVASDELIAVALADLGIPSEEYEAYLTGLLLDVNGWAAWAAYLRWTERLQGRDDQHIVEMLAVRLAWEWLLYRDGGKSLASRWHQEVVSWPAIDRAAETAHTGDWIMQHAVELAYQEVLSRELPRGLLTHRDPAPAVQVAFCIDVRSEVFRRALEAQSPSITTLGFAGFFGVPIEYQPLGAATARPQLPGLLAPKLRVTDVGVPDELGPRRAARLELASAWKYFKANAISGFSFVEALGLFYAGKLVSDGLGNTRPVPAPESAGLKPDEQNSRKPRLHSRLDGEVMTVAARCDLAAAILRAMSLTSGFARLVVLVGHGSQSVNNPHAAGLDCGACCGQTGEVNARAVAALLNDPEVRDGLAARGIDVPSSTRFVAGLHNTTTDHVGLFDLDELPRTHLLDWGALRVWLDDAAEAARLERAPRLGLEGRESRAVRGSLEARARDWSQVRPEWGLANCAAFIVAPREHSRHLNLDGRSFLHDYRWQEDKEFATLELIMTAPMVVTHWINFQYYASTVDNRRYGSGNKVLHNVVGTHLGVFEGNGGDLRIGLPMQSLHDGRRWMHEPLRLSVFIEAPRLAISAVIRKHETVRQLVDNGWIHLLQIDETEGAVWAYRRGSWERE